MDVKLTIFRAILITGAFCHANLLITGDNQLRMDHLTLTPKIYTPKAPDFPPKSMEPIRPLIFTPQPPSTPQDLDSKATTSKLDTDQLLNQISTEVHEILNDPVLYRNSKDPWFLYRLADLFRNKALTFNECNQIDRIRRNFHKVKFTPDLLHEFHQIKLTERLKDHEEAFISCAFSAMLYCNICIKYNNLNAIRPCLLREYLQRLGLPKPTL